MTAWASPGLRRRPRSSYRARLSGDLVADVYQADQVTRAGRHREWPVDPGVLLAEQQRLAALQPPPWHQEGSVLEVAAAVVTFGRGGHGHGRAAEPAWASAVLLRGSQVVAAGVVEGVAHSPYVPALQAMREGPLLTAAVEILPRRPDVLLLAAAGRDHPRRAGLALHVGAVLAVPSIGVTDRPLLARGEGPGPDRGDTSPLLLDGEEVARWVRTAPAVRPLVAHAAWRTDAHVAAAVLLSSTTTARTPLALREARRLARETRARA
jgi:deoxyribonuclease V